MTVQEGGRVRETEFQYRQTHGVDVRSVSTEINDTEIHLLPNSKNGFAVLCHLGLGQCKGRSSLISSKHLRVVFYMFMGKTNKRLDFLCIAASEI